MKSYEEFFEESKKFVDAKLYEAEHLTFDELLRVVYSFQLINNRFSNEFLFEINKRLRKIEEKI